MLYACMSACALSFLLFGYSTTGEYVRTICYNISRFVILGYMSLHVLM